MKLYHSPNSPYVRKVLATALVTGIYQNIELMPTDLSPLKPDNTVRKFNPLGKIPVLVLPDGTAIFDSPVICEYIDSLHSGTKMVPTAGSARWEVLRLNALADGLIEAAMAFRNESLRPEEKQSDEWIIAHRLKVDTAFDALETEVEKSLRTLSLGSIAVGCALGWIDFRLPNIDWRSTHSKLSQWYGKFSEESFMKKTKPPG